MVLSGHRNIVTATSNEIFDSFVDEMVLGFLVHVSLYIDRDSVVGVESKACRSIHESSLGAGTFGTSLGVVAIKRIFVIIEVEFLLDYDIVFIRSVRGLLLFRWSVIVPVLHTTNAVVIVSKARCDSKPAGAIAEESVTELRIVTIVVDLIPGQALTAHSTVKPDSVAEQAEQKGP